MTHDGSWKVSLHGGHSFPFCDHATGSLEEILEEAVAAGMTVYGVTEHAPRVDDRHLYPTERNRGWHAAILEELFEEYVEEVGRLAGAFSGRLTVLKGFEAEVVPHDRYVDLMRDLKTRYGLDYMVGAVHHVDDVLIDGPLESFEEVAVARGGVEALAVAYYDALREMVEALEPEVVAHFDLVRANASRLGPVNSPPIQAAVGTALDAMARHGAILELGVEPFRRGWKVPYPAPWIVEMARARGVPFCFGDGSHTAADVGVGLEEGRAYLLEHGIDTVTVLDRDVNGGLIRRKVSLGGDGESSASRRS
jgi:histidinol-phosphatase (PHP family)